MPSELINALFSRRQNVDSKAETWESKPQESSADAVATHLAELNFGAPSTLDWLRQLEPTPEEDTLAEALADSLKERGEKPSHAPGPATFEEAQRLTELQEAYAKLKEQFAAERQKLGDAKDQLARWEDQLQEREKAITEEREQQRLKEEARVNYPVPDWLEQPEGTINIGIVGNAGVGKSLLINRLRRVKSHADGWAPVGINETTMSPTMYSFAGCHGVRLWDLPGAGTEAFPSETYIQTMGLRYFDKVLILTAGRFTTTDVALQAELEKYKVPYFMVRTKVDIDAWNNKEDNNKQPSETLDEILADFKAHGVANVHLVSSRDPEAYDMNKLMKEFFPGYRRQLDPEAPTFCPTAPAWNEPWALPAELSVAVAGLQGRWYDGFGAVYLIQGEEAHVTVEGQNAIVPLAQDDKRKVWWCNRWWINEESVQSARWKLELRWAPANLEKDKPLIWWWSD